MTAFAPGLALLSGCTAVARARADGTLAACLIRGRPGAGKSTLALQMAAYGAQLVADDVVGLSPLGDTGVCVHAPGPPFAGLLEAPEFGLIRLPVVAAAPLVLVVELEERPPGADAPRLPTARTVRLIGRETPQTTATSGPATAAALFCLLGEAVLVDPETL